MVILVVGIALCVVVFAAAYFWPRRSRRLEGGVDRKLDRASATSGLVERPAQLLRKAVDASAGAGRNARRERESKR